MYELSARRPSGRRLILAGILFLVCRNAAGAALAALPEYLRPDPFGSVVAVDLPQGRRLVPATYGDARPLELKGARGAYVSFHLVVEIQHGSDYRLTFDLGSGNSKLAVDVFLEWFHFTESDRNYYPDALVPVSLPYSSRIPDPVNRIEKQTAQPFWVDIWVPPDTKPGVYRGSAWLETGKQRCSLPFRLEVLPAVVPADDVVTVDHNSYGSSWLADYYPGTKVPSDASFHLMHSYHRLFYEHRGIYHQLGYGHGGKVLPEFAPALGGSGRGRKIEDWELYDRQYGPLFDGSAFKDSRRGPRPIPFVYLPINPEWPASFLWWGEPGYEAEFVNVVGEMERHFREKGWTDTRFEMFFNHKKRYKAFPWDGDETRFPKDDQYFVEYGRLLKKAIPPDSPVRFVFRIDASWDMERQFKSLAGIIGMWVCGGSMFSWYDYAPALLKGRGDIVWIYGGPPPVTMVSSAITEHPLRVWLYGIDGWVHWQTVDPGSDPWFHFNGGGTVLAYPGTRFGINEPIPSLRLKIQRNCLQDLALLDSLKTGRGIDTLKQEVARRYNGTTPAQWWTPRPALADTPPYDWSNDSIDEATRAAEHPRPRLEPTAWEGVHRFVIELAAEEK
jgi:hypothetical protein